MGMGGGWDRNVLQNEPAARLRLHACEAVVPSSPKLGERRMSHSPKLVTTSDSKHQSAPDQHGHGVEHSTRRVRGGGAGAGEMRAKWPKMMSKLPYSSSWNLVNSGVSLWFTPLRL